MDCTEEEDPPSMAMHGTAWDRSPVNALAGVLEVELNTLVDEAGISRHDNGPSGVGRCHASDVEALLPLLVDPLEGEGVAYLRSEE